MNWLCEECFISHILNIIYIYTIIYIRILYTCIISYDVSYDVSYGFIWIHTDSAKFIWTHVDSIDISYMLFYTTAFQLCHFHLTGVQLTSCVALCTRHGDQAKRRSNGQIGTWSM